MASTTAKELIIDFVRESERISGIEFPDDPDKRKPGTKRHIEIATILSTPGGNVIKVDHINTALTDNRDEWLRNGTPGALKGIIPDGSEVAALIERLNQRIKRDVTLLMEHGTDEDRDQFAWQMHDLLISIHAFKEGSGRTPRLLLNHIRIQFGMPWFVIKYEKSHEYFAKLHEYKATKFSTDLDELRGMVLEEPSKAA